MEQLITIDEVGGVSSLTFKKDAGAIDLREFGKAEIVRTSEIVWSKLHQMYYVKFLTGKMKGKFYTHAIAAEYGITFPDAPPLLTVFFNEYEDGVAAEIEIVQAMRQYDSSLV